MPLDIAGFSLEPPTDFHPDEAMIPLAAPLPDAGDSRILNRQLTVRPNMILHRRPAPDSSKLELLAGELAAELIQSIPDMEGLTTERFEFADDTAGILVQFQFPAGQHARVQQWQALRLDGGRLTTITLSVDAATLNEARTAQYLGAIASVHVNAEVSQ